ncbi:MAG: DUF1501 domain-containing protein [Verrucomicrobiales bacterium]
MMHSQIPKSDEYQTRRRWLTGAVGTVAALGAAPLVGAAPVQPRKQLLLLFLSGGASQFETWDPKPGAKTGGPFRAIPTSIPGERIGELLPHTAKALHRLTVVRSVVSNIADHFQGHYALQSGRIAPGYPVLGSAVAKLLERPDDVLPGYVSIRRNGPKAYTDVGDAGFLGAKYDGVKVYDNLPPQNLDRPAGITTPLAESVERLRRAADARFRQRHDGRPIESYEATYQQAAALMKHREIFDLAGESSAMHDRYGRHEFGQHCLQARRLLEAGVTCVKVTHFDWDAHQDNFYWHQVRCAEFDRTFVTLLDDLEQRGMLEHTLVVVTGEMGRTPQINNLGGRDHWGRAWSMAMAGAGVKPGVIHGATNDLGTEVTEDPVTHGDLFHTYLRALGIDSRMDYTIGDQTNPVADPAAKPIEALLA